MTTHYGEAIPTAARRLPHNTAEAFRLTLHGADENSYWVTKDGQQVMIRDMSSDHLLNIVLIFKPKIGHHPLLDAMEARITFIQEKLKTIGAEAKIRRFIRKHGGYNK